MNADLDDSPLVLEWMPVECACGCDGLLWERIPEEPLVERWAVPGEWETPPAAPGPGVSRLVAAVDEIARVSPVGLTDEEALAETAALLAAAQKLRVLNLGRFADLQDRPLDSLDARSVRSWVARQAPDVDAADVGFGRKLAVLPTLTEAVTLGRVPVVAARKVSTALEKARKHLDRPDGLIDGQPAEPVIEAVLDNTVTLICQDHFGLADDDPLLIEITARVELIRRGGGSELARVEAAFTLLAEHLPDRPLKAALEQQLDALLPQQLEEQQEKAEERAYARLEKNPDGSWQLDARLSPECGERLFTAVSAEARRDPANPLDTKAREDARWEALRDPLTGELPDPFLTPLPEREPWDRGNEDEPLIPRSRSRRLHDAFHRLLERYLDSGLGGTHDKIPVQISATVSAALLEGQPGALPARGASGRSLARSLVRRWWCDAHVTTLLMSRGWQPLGLVHSARTLTGTERKAASVQFDNRCAGLGCCPGTPDPLIPLVPHHLIGHAIEGKTSLGETILACPTLHHDIHTGKRTIRLRNGRRVNEHGYLDD